MRFGRIFPLGPGTVRRCAVGLLVLGALVASVAAGCGGRQTIVLVNVDVESGLTGIVQLDVEVTNAGDTFDTLVPEQPGDAIEFPTSFSIGLDRERSGFANVTVVGLDAGGSGVGAGADGVDLVPADTVTATVELTGDGLEDDDMDGVSNALDNCRDEPNPGQEDGDDDGDGDACDNCPSDSNSAQSDDDSDEVGDACDNCPMDSNTDQDDGDMDGFGDACDGCPMDPDPMQPDGDMDTVGDVCDNCPTVSNTIQDDTVPMGGDGVGDACGDYDMDMSLDLDDCEPEDGTVFPGSVDLCNGMDEDCNVGYCTFDLSGLEVFDLGVTSAGVVGIAADGPGGAGVGAFRTLDGTDPAAAVLTTSMQTDPRAVAVNVAPRHNASEPDLFYVSDATDPGLKNYDSFGGPGLSGYPLMAPAGALAISSFGELVFTAMTNMNVVVVFDPCETVGMAADCYEQVGNTTNIDPVTLDLTLAAPALPPNPGLGLDAAWRVADIAIFHGLSGGYHLAYLVFDGQPGVVGLSVNATTLESASGSSSLLSGSPAPDTSVYLDDLNNHLLVTSADGVMNGEVRVYLPNAVASLTSLLSVTTIPGGAVSSCPSATVTDSSGTGIWIADPCNDVVWEGLKDPSGMVTLMVAHDVCPSPSHLVAVDGGGLADYVYIGCTGAIGVINSD